MKKSLCSVDDCSNPVWSKGLCKNHIARKPFPTGSTTLKAKRDTFVNKVKIEAMRQFFVDIWNERPHYSEVSGDYLGKEPLSTYFHHILPKVKYPDMAYEKSNIILLTLHEHEAVENDMYKFDIVNQRRMNLLNQINQ